jgi:hypothetical protein
MEKEIVFAKDAQIFLVNLLKILVEKGYYSFIDQADLYVFRMILYARKHIGILTEKDAPPYFNRYGSNLKYITYKANKTTSWYLFYQQRDNIFLIRHITNNHVVAQYFE